MDKDYKRASLAEIRAMKDAGMLEEPAEVAGVPETNVSDEFWDKAKVEFHGKAKLDK